jgi:hypothetical protein
MAILGKKEEDTHDRPNFSEMSGKHLKSEYARPTKPTFSETGGEHFMALL